MSVDLRALLAALAFLPVLASADPITVNFDLNSVYSENDITGAITYDSSAIPVCETDIWPTPEEEDLMTFSCTVENFIEAITVRIDDVNVEVDDLESDHHYFGAFYESNGYVDAPFGGLPDHFISEHFLGGYESLTLLNSHGGDFSAHFDLSSIGIGLGSFRLFDSKITFNDGLLDIRFLFDAAIFDGKLVRRSVPEPGTAPLVLGGLALLILWRRKPETK